MCTHMSTAWPSNLVVASLSCFSSQADGSWVWPVQGLVLFSQDSRWRWARLVFPVWERGGRGQVVGADSSIDTRHPTLWTQPSNFPDTSSLRRKGPGIIVSSIKNPSFQHRRSWAVLQGVGSTYLKVMILVFIQTFFNLKKTVNIKVLIY